MAKAKETKHQKNLAYYLSLPYTYTLTPDDGEFVVEVNELPGCLSQGKTPEEAIQRIREAMELWLSIAIEDDRIIPEPSDEGFSGRFLTRVPKKLHADLVRAAKKENVSLNLFVATALAQAVGKRAEPMTTADMQSKQKSNRITKRVAD